MNKKDNIKLKKIDKNDYQFLYDLLLERDNVVNISHKKMPTFEKHIKFVNSKPYLLWKIIYHDNIKSGSVYLTKQNEIGIFVKKEFQDEKIGSIVLKLIVKENGSGRYLANINPNNKKSIKFFKNHKFKLIQHTYEFIKS